MDTVENGVASDRGGIGWRGMEGRLGKFFGCLTNSATVNVIKGETTDTRPIELAFDEIPGLQTTRMTNRGSVMEKTNDRLTNVEISGDIELSFIEYETVLNSPVRGKEFLCWQGFQGEEVAKDIDYFCIEGLQKRGIFEGEGDLLRFGKEQVR